MIEDVRLSGKDRFDGIIVVVEIRDERFDHDARIDRTHGFNRLPKMFGPAIGQIIAGHSGEDDVLEAQPAGAFGYTGGFI